MCVYVGGGGGTDVENSPVSLNAAQLPVRVWVRVFSKESVLRIR